MSAFASALSIADQAQDAVYGEPVQWRPQSNGADSEIVAAGDDQSRSVRDLVGIFDDRCVISHPIGAGANTHDTADIVAGQTVIDLDASQFTAGIPLQGDHLVLTSQAGQPRYRVVSAQPDGLGRVICIVAALGATS